MRRIELTQLNDNSKVIIPLAHIGPFSKLPPPEGSNMFSGGTKILVQGIPVHVRDFYSVVDFLISQAMIATPEACVTPFRYFAGEDTDADKAYKDYKTLAGRDVQTPTEVEAQVADHEAPAVF